MNEDAAMTIDAMIGEAAARHGNAIAMLDVQGRALTYAELEREVAGIAAALRERGATRSSTIVTLNPNGPNAALAVLAGMTAGRVAPLNPTYTEAELDFYLSDLEPSIVLIDAGHPTPLKRLAEKRGIAVFELSTDDPSGKLRVQGTPRDAGDGPRAQPDDVALLLHTSGTTSRPKLVPLRNAQLRASMASIGRTLRLTPADRCLNVMPLFHIHGIVAALLSSLAHGGSVVCTPGMDAANGLVWLKELEATWYTAVPTIHHSMMELAQRSPELARSTKLRFIRSSSQSLPPTLMQRIEELFGVPLLEAYGMTEAAHQMASNPLPPAPRKPGSVGIAAGPEVGIMDADGVLQPQGARGEIVVRGETVFRGYLRNEAENARVFHDGWFRTGDEGVIDGDGYVVIAGRIKEIINKGGEKVSPPEVEEVLLQCPGVRSAAVFAIPHPTFGEDVAAAVVPIEKGAVSERAIQKFAASKLADFKVPNQIVILDKIPTGATGKLQRIGLAAQLKDHFSTPFIPPETDVERALARIWQRVLGVERVGLRDNFFALGGDSLRALTAMSLARGENLLVPRQFADHPTLGELARATTRQGAATAQGGTLERTGSAPLSAQQRWQRRFRNVLWTGYESSGAIDRVIFEKAVRAVVHHHDALRAMFRQNDKGELEQAISERRDDIEIDLVEARDVTGPDRIAWLATYLERMEARISIPENRLYAFVAIDFGDVRGFAIGGDHVLLDNYAINVVAEDLATAYAQIASGEPVSLGRNTTSLREVNVRMAQMVDSGALDREVPYWRAVEQKLKGQHSFLRPDFDHPPRDFADPGRAMSWHVAATRDPAFVEELHSCGVQPAELVVTAMLQTLAAKGTSRDVPVILLGGGRADVPREFDLSRTAGNFATLWPAVVTAPDLDATPAEQARQLRVQLDAIEGLGMNWLWLHEYERGKGELDASIHMDAFLLNYRGLLRREALDEKGLFTAGTTTFGSLVQRALIPVRSSFRPPKRFVFLFDITEEQFILTAGYEPERYEAATIEGLAEAFIARLRVQVSAAHASPS